MRSVPVGPILLAVLVLSVAQISDADAAVPEGDVEFQDGAGNAVDEVKSDAQLKVYVRDDDLDVKANCEATWTNLPATVLANERLTLSTGAPHSNVYSLSTGCAYDTDTPANTPFDPGSDARADVELPEDDPLGYTQILVVCCPDTDKVAFLTDVDAGSTIIFFDFNFHVANSYDASDELVKVSSDSDATGEWIAISEVASETDDTAAPKSGLFLGEVTLSPTTNQAGDGKVFVKPGDEVTVEYDKEEGIPPPISSDTVTVEAAPVPGVTGVGLAALAGLLAAAAAFRILRSGRARSRL